MAVKSCRAVVIRSRGDGRNLLVQMQGVDNRQAVQAAQDAAVLLAQAAAGSDPGDIVPGIQGVPLTSGSVLVMDGRWRVSYRVLGHVLVMAVTRTSSNAFTGLNILSAVASILIAEAKGLEVTVERVEKRFAEVYLAVDGVVSSSGLTSASSEDVYSALQGMAGEGKAVKPTPLVDYTNTKRSLGGQLAQVTKMSFSTSALKGVKPLPGFELQQQPQQPQLHPGYVTQIMPTGAVDPFASLMGTGASADPFAKSNLFGPPQPGQAASTTASKSPLDLDDLFGLGTSSANKPAATAAVAQAPITTASASINLLDDDPFDLRPLQPAVPAAKPVTTAAATAAPDAWASFGAEAAPAPPAQQAKDPFMPTVAATMAASVFEASPFPAAATLAAPPPAPAPPEPPSAPLLQLQEVYRAEVQGSSVVRAGLLGSVLWLPEAGKADGPGAAPHINFGLQVPDFADERLKSALHAAKARPAVVHPSPQAPGAFAAVISAAATSTHQAPLLAYQLPAASCTTPLQVRMDAGLRPLPDGQLCVVLSLHCALNPQPGLQPETLQVELSIPSSLELPARVAPSGAFVDGQAKKLTWQLRGLYPGWTESLAATFVVSSDREACVQVLRRATAQVTLAGRPGDSLSGLQLYQDLAGEAPAQGGWTAVVTCSPSINSGV